MNNPLNRDEIRKLYERGVPVSFITKAHKISRQTISKYAKQYGWNHPRYKRVKQFEKIEYFTKQTMRKMFDHEQKLLKLHSQEFQVVRRLLQAAIDHESMKTASLAKHISETLVLVHQSELDQLTRSEGKIASKRQFAISSALPLDRRTFRNRKINEFSRQLPQPAGDITIIELFEKWQQSKIQLAPSTSSHWRKAINTFIEFVGHSNPFNVSRDDAIRWREWLLAQNFAHKTIESSYIGAPRAVFNYAVASGYLDTNPFRVIQLPKIKTVRKRSKAYSDEEARMILRASLKLTRGHEKEHVHHLRKWAPWLAAFTGARINEICQLRKEDVQQRSGLWCIHITPEAGPVKSKLDRIVPLHPQLIAIGFIDFIKTQKSGYVFSHDPKISGARDRSKIIGSWIRSLGIRDPDISPNHAWRHRFKTICRQAGIQTEYQNALTGHVNERNSGLAYGDFPVKALYREICKLPSHSVQKGSNSNLI